MVFSIKGFLKNVFSQNGALGNAGGTAEEREEGRIRFQGKTEELILRRRFNAKSFRFRVKIVVYHGTS